MAEEVPVNIRRGVARAIARHRAVAEAFELEITSELVSNPGVYPELSREDIKRMASRMARRLAKEEPEKFKQFAKHVEY